ncbi:hypothetical protein OUZ56_009336 [Daphnia magna]|uniref:Uncharacterized protein n=1 Tax=Daphnia magna TaxID=35525 RepID=A0ABR0AFP1_9CRUS|nr:hypothetical protein OUZ56_009336 [Daphnia magna]
MALFLLEQAIGCVYTRICLNALDGEIGPPLSGTEAAKRSGRLSLVGSGYAAALPRSSHGLPTQFQRSLHAATPHGGRVWKRPSTWRTIQGVRSSHNYNRHGFNCAENNHLLLKSNPFTDVNSSSLFLAALEANVNKEKDCDVNDDDDP